MTEKRESYSDDEHSILYAESGGVCPLCTRPILFKKSGSKKPSKGYEIIKLREIKDGYLSEAKARLTISEHAIRKEVCEILDVISTYDLDGADLTSIGYDLSTVDKKLKTGMSPLQKREIKQNAINFYVRIRNHIRLLEQQDQASVRILQNQIKSYYLAMNGQNPENKDLVFKYVAEWISVRSSKSLLASKVLVSFFVQNCEVFDADSD